MSSPVAFFDLDRTLIDTNSGTLFALSERREGRISLAQLAISVWWTTLYHFDLVDIDRAYGKAVSLYRGHHTDDLARITTQWFEREVRHRIRPGAETALTRHRSQGHPLVLLTNSSCYLSTDVCRTWGLDDWLANTYPLDGQGRITGALELPLCYGEGKVVRAAAWCETRGHDLSDAWFYTDSVSDLPMLEAVGHPVVVNPDPRLRRIARRRGWPVEDWGHN